MIYCGPTEWRFERRRGSSIDRKNTVRHLIQMMAISEEGAGSSPIPPQMREEDEEGEEENGVEKPPAMSQSLPVQSTSQPFSKYIYCNHSQILLCILYLIMININEQHK